MAARLHDDEYSGETKFSEHIEEQATRDNWSPDPYKSRNRPLGSYRVRKLSSETSWCRNRSPDGWRDGPSTSSGRRDHPSYDRQQSSSTNSRVSASDESWSSRTRPRSRDDSPSYSPPRSSTGNRRERSPVRSFKRSGSPIEPWSSKRSRSPVDVKNIKRSRSPDTFSTYSKDDLEAIQSMYCRICDVKLHDQDSMKSHVDGRRHLAQKQKIIADQRRKQYGSGRLDCIKTDPTMVGGYSEDYWKRCENDTKQQMYNLPTLAKVYDTARYDSMKAQFDRRKYDHGQFEDSTRELYCELCGVTVATRDVMESHKQGKEHQRKAAVVKRFECKICLISVPCQNTLDNHMRGKGHIKAARELEAGKRQRERIKTEDGVKQEEVDTPSNLQQLETENNKLKRQLREEMFDRQQCTRTHGPADRALAELDQLEAELQTLQAENTRLRRRVRAAKRQKQDRGKEVKAEVKTEAATYEDDEYREEIKPRIIPDVVTLD